jgi:hypothetical protein
VSIKGLDLQPALKFERLPSGAIRVGVVDQRVKTMEIPAHDWCRMVVQLSLYPDQPHVEQITRLAHLGTC